MLMLLLSLLACRTDKDVEDTAFVDADGDGWSASDDCDDTNGLIYPGAPESDCTDPVDYNCDGSVGYADDDGDGYPACEDCDDADPGSNEPSIWYGDADGDGVGGDTFSLEACTAPVGYVASSDDCDDLDPTALPGGTEACDEADNDCDDVVDEGVLDIFFADADGDGFGDADTIIEDCRVPTGYVANDADCDDTQVKVNPAAYEICDGVDNDCDDQTDDASAINASTWYIDADDDGYGDAETTASACDLPEGYADNDADCDDDDGEIFPGAAETCDDADEDCDGQVDEDGIDGDTWYEDADGDGFGGTTQTMSACDQPSGYEDNDDDCDDTDGDVNPDAAEICDGVDNDCDGTDDNDDEVLGSAEDCPGESCNDILTERSSVSDGSYWVDPTGADAFEVTCDMTTDGGGWTVIAESTDFAYQIWSEGDTTKPFVYEFSDTRIDDIKAVSTEASQDWACQTIGVHQVSYQSNWIVNWDGSNSQFSSCQDINNSAYRSDSGTVTSFSLLPMAEWHPQDCGDSSEKCQHNVDDVYFR